jgi:nitroimidazol reductase NimA-like FMN-containing flavoprotein (pyridoxamine 5'-phosphate oxidase superfamily)
MGVEYRPARQVRQEAVTAQRHMWEAPSVATGDRVYEELSVGECLELLGSHQFGRLAVVIDARPVLFPINYALDGDSVVFRTAPGTKLSGAALGHVAFEIDEVDETTQTGWSVIVKGVGNDITSTLDERSEQLRALEIQPWVPGEHAHWVGILAQSVTGRRLRLSQAFETP